ncbi:hypothetical protein KBC04_02715 [Candidatus Babeliales bacterium]|nr:hypothetical protein [Candidatus Babeliales bacterium]MBP9844035.1 hypothetical protein [Candidatus Babeliales bacterium]
MQNMLPPELMDSSLKLSTNAGEVVAVFAETGETVDCVMASKASMDRFAKNTGKGAGAKRALDPFDDTLNSEPKKGTPEWDKKYPNGKYEGADYHRE